MNIRILYPMLASFMGPELGEHSTAYLVPLSQRDGFHVPGLAPAGLETTPNASHYICTLSSLGARSPLGASGDTSSSIK